MIYDQVKLIINHDGAAAGFSGAFILSGGDISLAVQGALMGASSGALTGGVMFGVGELAQGLKIAGTWRHSALQGVGGGISRRAQGGDFCRTSIIMLANCNLKRPNAVALRHQQSSCQVLKRFWWQGFTSLRLFKRCYSIAPKLAKSKNAFCVSQGLTHYTGSVYKMNRLMGDSLEGTTAMSAALGGTISSLSGGSFQNGAMTAAFAHLYNDSLHYDHSRKKLQHLDDDGNLVDEWDAISGYGGKNELPEAEYSLRGSLKTWDPNIAGGEPYCKDGKCFFQGLSNQYDPVLGRIRTGLGIHPDGNIPYSTAGCIGLQNGHSQVFNLINSGTIDRVTVSH